jgi:hypothetical protein
MDEMNPAFENFLNNMSRLGGTPRETTRRVSPAKFLSGNNLVKQVAINSRKITILKNVIQARRVSTGSMLTSLSGGSVRGVEKEILDIKQTMMSILETLKAQEKFEYQKFLDMQRREENDKRRGRESFLEKARRKGVGIIRKGVNQVVSPISNIFSNIIGFFVKLFFGRIMIKFLNFFSNPANVAIVDGIANFIGTFFPVIVAGVVAATVGIAALAVKMLGLTNVLRAAAIGLGLTSPLSNLLGLGLSGRGLGLGRGFKLPTMTMPKFSGDMLMKRVPAMSKFSFPYGKAGRGFFNFNQGGVVPGSGNSDTVPAMLTPGEVVISKPAVDMFGLRNLLRLNNAAGKTNRPNISAGRFYANEGMAVPDLRFTPSMMDRVYTESSGSLEDGTYESRSRIMSLEETQRRLSEAYKGAGLDILPGQFLPNIGGKVVNKASEISNQYAPGSFKNIMNQTGMSKEDVQFMINSQLAGTEEYHMKSVSDSINQNTAKFKPKNKTNSLINLAPVTSNTEGEMQDEGFGSFNQLNNQDDTDSSFDNDLFDISLEKADSSKMQTLGMMP